MSIPGHFLAAFRTVRWRLTRRILAHRVCARHPTLRCDPTAIWDYGYTDIDAIEIGVNVSVCANAEIIVYKRSPHSNVPGSLVLGDNAIVSSGVSIRAAGGTVRIGRGSAVSQNSVVVAANHEIIAGKERLHARWDEERCGVELGDNVWVGALCVLLPGCRIGDNSVIGAGSVVRGIVPAGELWAGVPARRIRALD